MNLEISAKINEKRGVCIIAKALGEAYCINIFFTLTTYLSQIRICISISMYGTCPVLSHSWPLTWLLFEF